MKILVTGGCGFIGSNFIYLVLKQRPNWEIVCVDKLTYAANFHTLNNALKNKRFKFYKADITKKKDIDSIFKNENPDIVVNFAAESHVDRSIMNPSLFLKTNIIGTQVLMDACLKYKTKRFHQVSTDEVYGDLPLDKKDLFFTESTPLHTSSPYSSSKAAADLLGLAYFKTYGLPITISRCSNNYGPYQFPEKLIPLLINNASNNKSLPIYGNGENIRDWLFVDDHCLGILAILEKGKIGEVYNLGGHNEKSNIEIAKIVLKELGKSESLITYVKDRKGHDLRYAIDPSKALKDLGWKPLVKFSDGIKLTIDWYEKNHIWLSECLTKRYLEFYYKNYNK